MIHYALAVLEQDKRNQPLLAAIGRYFVRPSKPSMPLPDDKGVAAGMS